MGQIRTTKRKQSVFKHFVDRGRKFQLFETFCKVAKCGKNVGSEKYRSIALT